MTPRERVLAAINGDRPDRVPFCFWYHINPTPAAGPDSKMGQIELDFYKRYQPDIMKVMHDIDFEPIPRIQTVDDWAKLQYLEPAAGNFGKQLYTLNEIRSALDPDVPMLGTVFGLYHYAEEISEGRLLSHLREDAHAVHAGLKALAETLAAYAVAVINVGADGIYYAMQGALADGATRQEYHEQFLGYDRLILHAVDKAPMNVLHIHGRSELYFDLVHDLPASVVCWSDVVAGPSIAQAREMHNGCLMGGIDETRFSGMTRAQIIAQARAAIEAGGTKFILGPGCSIPADSDPELIEAFRAAVN